MKALVVLFTMTRNRTLRFVAANGQAAISGVMVRLEAKKTRDFTESLLNQQRRDSNRSLDIQPFIDLLAG